MTGGCDRCGHTRWQLRACSRRSDAAILGGAASHGLSSSVQTDANQIAGKKTVSNPFAVSWVAPEYAVSRPDVHSRFIEVAHQEMGSPPPFARALDIGCGTGLSCRALLRVAQLVVGIDPSIPMLQHAASPGAVFYIAARAEAIPVVDAAFDVACISCAFHWCEPERLLSEVGRLVRPGGWLLIFDSTLRGWSDGSREPVECLTAEYWSRLPYCPRNPYFDPAHHQPDAFALHATRFVKQPVRLSVAGLSAFIRTQASTVAAVQSGHATLPELRDRLDGCLYRLFAGNPTKELLLGGVLSILLRR